MSEFKIKCRYNLKENQKFFNDKEPREYYRFLVLNPEIIPAEYLYIRKCICYLLISENLIKKFRLDFKVGEDYQFIINLEEKRTAKFTTKNRNEMVLSSLIYFENTVKKIGTWGSENYFYERKGDDSNNKNDYSLQDRNRNNLTKIFLFSLPVFLLGLVFFLIIRWASKRKTIKYK